ncbi:hypothetical protein MLD38_000582 [Melastoma candidum]|uniref:Uncharacterized protein n=1 Tax=Melastoma candidum TaxID=119954 RepID=A0ACB9SBF5_9MYRT|nr:hypothetical protein MLD38_000582 [Melastoma candidum]
METSLVTILLSILIFPVLVIAWSTLNWVWIRPRKLERILRLQGLSGNPYRFLSGDLRDSSLMLRQAQSRPSSVSDDLKTLVHPFLNQLIKTHGKNSFMWLGTIPRVRIWNVLQVKHPAGGDAGEVKDTREILKCTTAFRSNWAADGAGATAEGGVGPHEL